MVNETKCLECETVTSREEAFYDLSLEIEQNCSLTACLRNFRCPKYFPPKAFKRNAMHLTSRFDLDAEAFPSQVFHFTSSDWILPCDIRMKKV